MRRINISLIVASALVLLVCCTKSKLVPITPEDPDKLVPISPDDPNYCDHCPCERGRVTCPGEREPSLCTLSGLWDAQRRWVAEHHGSVPLIIGAWNCGKYVVVEELCGIDCLGLYAYDASTGQIAASRRGGGTLWLRCDDGYRTDLWTQPPGFIFPKREGCSALNAPELGLPTPGQSPFRSD